MTEPAGADTSAGVERPADGPPPARYPRATYRLQMGPTFGFAEATGVVPYLAALGISHLYLSPIWEARPGSTHGYDIIDHSRVSGALGGLEGLYGLAEAAAAHGMGLILDIVPNHVGIERSRHPWWREVLRFGQSSPIAPFFDIAWEGRPERPGGVVVSPVLGAPFGVALEAGELTLDHDGHELVVRYYDHSFPLSPRSYQSVLGLPPLTLGAAAAGRLAGLLEEIRDAEPASCARLLEEFSGLIASEPTVRDWVESRLRALDGTIGQPHTFDALDAILGEQNYRLAYWRVSAEEINYRRFFDINELAAIRVEYEPTFQLTHELVARLAKSGVATGLRVDHVDGLFDPGQYLAHLQETVAGSPGEIAPSGFPIWVEKILARNETLPEHWPVAGTTGYEFLAKAGGLFINSSAGGVFSDIYQEFLGQPVSYGDVVFAARRRISGRAFAGEVNVLALELHRIAQAQRRDRDNTVRALREAIAGLLSCLPVYRTYLEDDKPMEADARIIVGAELEALRRDPNLTTEAMTFLVRVLLLEGDDLAEGERARWLGFRRRFQQLSGPIMAKGVEDTTYFRYHRLLALNEVGDTPEYFGVAPEEAHAWFEARAKQWPHGLSATTTHDTKRSEDARMRLAVLSEHPRRWRSEVRSWARLNRRWLRNVNGRPVPDPNTEYYVYQTLVAAWQGLPDASFRSRMEEHMIKAVREAKVFTGWISVDAEFEGAVTAFLKAILDRRRSARFVARVEAFVRMIEPGAAVNTLALLTLKCTTPGIPDFYQGAEFPLRTLTDPDNRRAVDFKGARAAFAALPDAAPEPTSLAAKPWLAKRLLELRARCPELFTDGRYRAIEVGGASSSFFAFAREQKRQAVIVVVPRLASQGVDASGRLNEAELAGRTLPLPSARRWKNWLTGEKVLGTNEVALHDLLGGFPIGILVAGDTPS